MKRTLMIPIVIICLLVGCRPEENREQLLAINENVEYTNGVILDANKLIYEKVSEMEKDPGTAYHARIWGPRARWVKLYADSVKSVIRGIKSNLITQSDSFRKEHVTIVKQLQDANGIGTQLFNKLIVFKDSALSTIFSDGYIPQVFEYFQKNIPILPGYKDSLSADYKMKWLEKNFGKTSLVMTMIMLNKVESEVLTSEREFITYCHTKIPTPCGYNKFQALVSLSSTYVKAGQSIEVTAGIGAFSEAEKPRITINGKKVELGVDATAVYKFIATGAPGKHTIPISIEYVRLDGTTGFVKGNREYIIADN